MKGVVFHIDVPDRPFFNFRASRLGDQRILCCGTFDRQIFEVPKWGKGRLGRTLLAY